MVLFWAHQNAITVVTQGEVQFLLDLQSNLIVTLGGEVDLIDTLSGDSRITTAIDGDARLRSSKIDGNTKLH